MANYIDVSTIVNGALAKAATVRTAFEALDTELYEVATGATAITPDIDGGTIDGAVIGGTTPAAATFTTIIATTSLDINNSSGTPALRFNDGNDDIWYLLHDPATNDFNMTHALAGVFIGPVLSLKANSGTRIWGELDHDGSTVGFYGATPQSKPTVTGSRGGNAALTSLLTALSNLGLITNSTS